MEIKDHNLMDQGARSMTITGRVNQSKENYDFFIET